MDPEFDPAETRRVQLGPDDLLTLIYTSGTTGPPKGVQLTHRNLLFAVATADEMIELPGARRQGDLLAARPRTSPSETPTTTCRSPRGVSVTICSDPRRIAEFLPKVNPTWFFAVPRIFEKLKAGLEAMMAGLPDEQREPAEKGLEASLQKVRARAGRGGGPAGGRRGGRPGGRADVLPAAQAARPRRGARGQRRRRADPARGARVLPRDRDPGRRALGHVGDLRARHHQPARPDQARHRRPADARGRDQARRRRRGPGEGGLRDARATGTCPRRTRRRSPTTAGCAPATSARSTRTAT